MRLLNDSTHSIAIDSAAEELVVTITADQTVLFVGFSISNSDSGVEPGKGTFTDDENTHTFKLSVANPKQKLDLEYGFSGDSGGVYTTNVEGKLGGASTGSLPTPNKVTQNGAPVVPDI